MRAVVMICVGSLLAGCGGKLAAVGALAGTGLIVVGAAEHDPDQHRIGPNGTVTLGVALFVGSLIGGAIGSRHSSDAPSRKPSHPSVPDRDLEVPSAPHDAGSVDAADAATVNPPEAW